LFTDCLVHFSVLGEFEQFYGHKVHESVDSKKKKDIGKPRATKEGHEKKKGRFFNCCEKMMTNFYAQFHHPYIVTLYAHPKSVTKHKHTQNKSRTQQCLLLPLNNPSRSARTFPRRRCLLPRDNRRKSCAL